VSPARYREYQPCPALRPYVKSLFTFELGQPDDASSACVSREVVTAAGESPWSAMFADSGVSIVFCFGDGYRIDGLWSPRRASAHVIGPMTGFRNSSPGEGLLQVGAYLHSECAPCFLGVPGREIVDRVVGLNSLWPESRRVEDEIASCGQDSSRVAVLEAALLRRLHPDPLPLAAHLARLARLRAGRVTVESIAELAGVSRQFLSRTFRERLGMSPKLYLRLCRFRVALGSPASGSGWADAASAAGYFDQSHMIADFRQFSGMTPAAMVRKRVFHPFTRR
jgi:AraC-like DNA-binding protein